MKVDDIPRIYLVDGRSDDPLPGQPDVDISQPNPPTASPQTWSIIRQAHVWQPPTDVFEFPDRLMVRVEIAGMRDGAFQVALRDRKLSISGSRPRGGQERGALQYHRMEIGYGDFRVEISLPWPVGRGQATAIYRDGFLMVELPQAPHQQMYVVDVEPAATVERTGLERADTLGLIDLAEPTAPPEHPKSPKNPNIPTDTPT